MDAAPPLHPAHIGHVLDSLLRAESELSKAIEDAEKLLEMGTEDDAVPADVILKYARMIANRTSAPPGWDGKRPTSHPGAQPRYLAPTYAMLAESSCWLQRVAHQALPQSAPPAVDAPAHHDSAHVGSGTGS